MPGSDLTSLFAPLPDDGVKLRSAVVSSWDVTSGGNVLNLGDGTTVSDVPSLAAPGGGPQQLAAGDVVVVLVWRQVWLVLGPTVSP